MRISHQCSHGASLPARLHSHISLKYVCSGSVEEGKRGEGEKRLRLVKSWSSWSLCSGSWAGFGKGFKKGLDDLRDLYRVELLVLADPEGKEEYLFTWKSLQMNLRSFRDLHIAADANVDGGF